MFGLPSFVDGKMPPIPLALPTGPAATKARREYKKTYEETIAKKFSGVPEADPGPPVVRASLFFVDGAKLGVYPGEDASSGVTAIFFDLILSEEHGMTAVASEHPMEDGSVKADHIQNALREGSFSGLVTNFSVHGGHAFSYAEATGRTAGNRAWQAFSALERIHEDKKLVTLNLALKGYDNVAITKIGARRDGATGDQQTFEISFKQMEILTLKKVSIKASVHPAAMKTKKEKEAGVKLVSGDTAGTPVLEDPETEVVSVEDSL